MYIKITKVTTIILSLAAFSNVAEAKHYHQTKHYAQTRHHHRHHYRHHVRRLPVAEAPVVSYPEEERPGFFHQLWNDGTAVVGKGRSVITSWYGGGEKLNAHTANGERFNPNAFTVAHRTLPFGTKLRISYGGRSLTARVNDRGPAAWTGRRLDCSRAIAEHLGFKSKGQVHVQIAVLPS